MPYVYDKELVESGAKVFMKSSCTDSRGSIAAVKHISSGFDDP